MQFLQRQKTDSKKFHNRGRAGEHYSDVTGTVGVISNCLTVIQVNLGHAKTAVL